MFSRKSTSRQRSTRAARKFLPVQGESDSSDSRVTTSNSQNDDSDSGVHLDHDVGRRSPPDRQNLVPRKRVTFDIRDDASDSGDTTVRVKPPQRHSQQHLPTQSELPRSPPRVGQTKPNNTRKTQKSRGSALNQSDITDDRPRKSTHGINFRVVEDKKWGSQKAKHFARMSIGSAGRRKISQSSSMSQQDKRRRWFVRRAGFGSRARRRTSHHADGDESNESDEDLSSTLTLMASKAARKSESQVATKRPRAVSCELDNESQQGIDIAFQDSAVADDLANEYLTDPPENHEEEVLEHSEPSQPLLERFEWLSLTVVRLQKMRRLPFLRRNLQRGFQLHCRLIGVDTKPYPLPRTTVPVVYYCPLADRPSSHSIEPHMMAKSSMKEWICPLCDLHRKFSNPRVLEKHLAWDHSSVGVHWAQRYTMLSLTIPDSKPESNPVITRQALIRSTSELSSDSKRVENDKGADPDEKHVVRTSSTPSGAASESGAGSVSVILSAVEEDVKPKYDTSGYSNYVGSDTWTRSSSVSRRSASKALSEQDGLGPSIVPPYLPETDEKGNVYYSCRPGGPRLFDFLNNLSLKPYGVLKWMIIDREEELFELDDILDEDKVMLALWYRWIFLHRNRFVANYFDGTKAFVKENWELIKKGAGLLALRTWLLVLLVNNFLLPTEVATLMRYYQELADIQLR